MFNLEYNGSLDYNKKRRHFWVKRFIWLAYCSYHSIPAPFFYPASIVVTSRVNFN